MHYPHIEPLEARIAPATLSIADAQFTEGDSGRISVTFTVTLSEAEDEVVRVDYFTTDGTATSSGAFFDFGAQDRKLAFLPGETVKTIALPIIGDLYREVNETFTVTLRNPVNATLGDATAIGTILNGGDTVLGLVLEDARVVEGAPTGGAQTSQKAVAVRAVLSTTATTAVSFTLATQAGTAVAGADFVAASMLATIPAGAAQVLTSFNVVSDRVFEATETFFVNLTGASANVAVANDDPIFPAAQDTARVYIFNDDTQLLGRNMVQWIDVDGDLVTLTVSKGQDQLSNPNLLTLVDAGTVGGRQLQRMDLSVFGNTFAGASISIIATKQAGFPDATDGEVDVGFIKGTIFDPDELRAVGVDLGVVTVDGDLARITAGDSFATPAIRKLDIVSLGARGTTTLAAADAPAAGSVVESKVLGPISAMVVKDDVNSFLRVIGAEFGVIGSLKIGGSLQGGAANASGAISVSGRLGTTMIGNIIGGAGDNSGLLLGSPLGNSSFGKITVTGSIIGGAGDDSGEIQAPRIGSVSAGKVIGGTGQRSGIIYATSALGNVTVSSDLLGGGGAQSGYIFSEGTLGNVTIDGDLRGGSAVDSGEIAAETRIGAVKIGGDVVGAAGENSGSIRTSGGIASLAVAGILAGGGGTGSGSILAGANVGAVSFGIDGASNSVTGGTGANSGGLDIGGNLTSLTTAGSILGGPANSTGAVLVTGSIGKLTIGRSLLGGDSGAAFVDKTGYIFAQRLKSVTIAGNIVAGDPGAGGLGNSGAIHADVIDALTVRGNVTGSTANPVVITASGLTADLAIKSVNILGNVAQAEILAGYNGVATAANFRGAAVSADASIGTVRLGGTVAGLNLVAGGVTGADGRFGTDDDVLASSSSIKNAASVISRIASVIIQSPAAIATNPAAYGIVAQHVTAVTIGTMKVGLTPGAGNDVAAIPTDTDPGIELKLGSRFRALELRLAL